MKHAVFAVSLDFELFWGLHSGRTLDSCRKNLDGVRKAIPQILEAFKTAGIHATWACVGFLFLSGKEEAMRRLPRRIPAYSDPSLSYLKELEWITPETERYYFAPDMIRLIRSYPNQEIGTHTFSHFYCLEDGQTAEDFEADIERAKEVAEEQGIQISSIVYPRNQRNPAYDPLLIEQGFRAFRGTGEEAPYRAGSQGNTSSLRKRAVRFLDAYLPLVKQSGYDPSDHRGTLVDLRASRFLRPYSKRLSLFEPLKIKRITAEMTEAAEKGLLYHLWWHPHNFGTNIDENMQNLEQILACYSHLRRQYVMESLSMSELADTLYEP